MVFHKHENTKNFMRYLFIYFGSFHVGIEFYNCNSIFQVKSMSSKSLSASVSDISSVVSMIDRIAGSVPGNGSRAAVGEDLVAITESHLQARNYMPQDGSNGTRKMRPYTSAMPLNVVSSAGSMNDSFKQLTGSETSDLESTVTSSIKRPRIEV
jgi:PAX-interacting protein 1